MLKYSVEEVKKLIDEYFTRAPSPIKDCNGKDIGEYDTKPPTLAGLRRVIGSQNWARYKELPEYAEKLQDAEDRVEEWHESRLSASSCTGSIFWLKSKKQWRDGDNPNPSLVVSMSLDKSDEELYKKNLGAFFGVNAE